MVTRETFALYQQSTEQRLTSAEAGVAQALTRCDTARAQLQAEVDRVENARATDRRAMWMVAATLLAALIGAVVVLLTLFL